MPRLIAVVPMLTSLMAFILAVLTLRAGSAGFMQQDYVMSLNVSKVGQNIISQKYTAPSTPGSGSNGPPQATNPLAAAWGVLTGTIDNATAIIEEDLQNGITNLTNGISSTLIKDVLGDLGLQDFYDLHLTSICHGNYLDDGSKNVTCPTATATGSKMDVAGSLTKFNQALEPLANVGLNISTIVDPQAAQLAADSLTTAIIAIVSIFVGGAFFTGLSIVTSTVGLLKPSKKRWIGLNIAVTGLGYILTFFDAALVTLVLARVKPMINGLGKGLNVNASSSAGFLALLWAAAVFQGISLVVWSVDFFMHYRVLVASKAMPVPMPTYEGHFTSPSQEKIVPSATKYSMEQQRVPDYVI